MLTKEEIEAIPRPKTWADYAACYRVNLVEARENLTRALDRFDALKRAGTITEKADAGGGYVFADVNAKAAYGAVVRWRSDLEHWHTRMVEAEKNMRAEAVQAPDVRLPPEHDDEEVPF